MGACVTDAARHVCNGRECSLCEPAAPTLAHHNAQSALPLDTQASVPAMPIFLAAGTRDLVQSSEFTVQSLQFKA